ncbi:hypothetical protein GCM10011584_05260 [Nocardioides phosphati]|uniref:Uncharacterized protein n=1 Tax=Nocardioides phosphati TaxID=1867775 RepID=A0ABQ2N779_9ACTN|nr:hypothetical protein GCM10011584_05260 [Nocardioides phosphati]
MPLTLRVRELVELAPALPCIQLGAFGDDVRPGGPHDRRGEGKGGHGPSQDDLVRSDRASQDSGDEDSKAHGGNHRPPPAVTRARARSAAVVLAAPPRAPPLTEHAGPGDDLGIGG